MADRSDAASSWGVSWRGCLAVAVVVTLFGFGTAPAQADEITVSWPSDVSSDEQFYIEQGVRYIQDLAEEHAGIDQDVQIRFRRGREVDGEAFPGGFFLSGPCCEVWQYQETSIVAAHETVHVVQTKRLWDATPHWFIEGPASYFGRLFAHEKYGQGYPLSGFMGELLQHAPTSDRSISALRLSDFQRGDASRPAYADSTLAFALLLELSGARSNADKKTLYFGCYLRKARVEEAGVERAFEACFGRPVADLYAAYASHEALDYEDVVLPTGELLSEVTASHYEAIEECRLTEVRIGWLVHLISTPLC